MVLRGDEMKKLPTVIFAAMLSTQAVGQNIEYQVGNGPTGGNAMISNVFKDHLVKNGFNVDLRITGSCAVSKVAWENVSGPMIYIMDSYLNGPSGTCKTSFEKEKVLAIAYEFPQALCSLTSKGLEDFIKPGAKNLIGSIPNINHDELFADIERFGNIKNTVLTYKNTAELQTAAKSKEIEWVFMSKESAEKAGATCIWSTSRDGKDGLRKASDLWPKARHNQATYYSWFVTKNVTSDQINKLQSILVEAYESPAWKDIAKARGYTGFTTDPKNIAIVIGN
jgi:hypothetical protein